MRHELLRHGGVSGSSFNNGLHSIEIDVASDLFNMYKADDLQWHMYTLFHASWNQAHMITLCEIIVGHFLTHEILVDAYFVSMGVLAIGRVLCRGVNEVTITWLDVGYARDVNCDLFRCGYVDRW